MTLCEKPPARCLLAYTCALNWSNCYIFTIIVIAACELFIVYYLFFTGSLSLGSHHHLSFSSQDSDLKNGECVL